MLTYGIRVPLVQIGNISRGSYFAESVAQRRGVAMGTFRLGQTGMEWYDRARNAVSAFERMLAQVEAMPSLQKAEVLAWIGQTTDQSSPRYRYVSVVDDIRTVEAADPLNYAVYDVERRQNRVTKLEEFNQAFAGRIQLAQRTPAGQVPARSGAPAPTAPAAGSDYTIPLVIGGGAAAVLLAVLLAS